MGARQGPSIVFLVIVALVLGGIAALIEVGGSSSQQTSTATASAVDSGGGELCDRFSKEVIIEDPDREDLIYDLILVYVVKPYSQCDIVDIAVTAVYSADRPLASDQPPFYVKLVAEDSGRVIWSYEGPPLESGGQYYTNLPDKVFAAYNGKTVKFVVETRWP